MTNSNFDGYLKNLFQSNLIRFANWDIDKAVMPNNVTGVYIIIENSKFIYAAMAKRVTQTRRPIGSDNKPKGLLRRLGKHASGNRGGNMFCVYVCDRFIVPYLTIDEMNCLKNGTLKLDGKHGKIKKYIRSNFSYKYLVIENLENTKKIEKILRKGKTSLGKPLLNPSKDNSEN
jgi:hypothetical protein